jgi:type II secretory pathway component PulF
MPTQYKYKALGTDGTRRTGTMLAGSPVTVEEFLRDQDLLPIVIKALETKRPFSLFGFLKGSDYDKLIMFTSALATMYRAGIPLLQTLSTIRIGNRDSRFNRALDQIKVDLQTGKPLSEAMDRFPDIFSQVYVNCVAAGEESGKLDATLDQLSAMLEREAELTRQLKAGIRYPLMVVAAIVGALVVLMNFVVPRFSAFYSAFNAELPLPTRIIIGVSNFATTYWPVMLLAMVLLVIGFRSLLRRKPGRRWFDRQLLRLPVLGELIIKGNVARFCLMFRLLISSGLTIVRSLDILTGTIKNAVIAGEIDSLGDSFRRGREIDLASGRFRFFPSQALHMLAVGLESGNLETMLHEIGEHYTKQVIYTSRQLTSILEPILTLVMGAFVLILALAVFLPMWNLIRVVPRLRLKPSRQLADNTTKRQNSNLLRPFRRYHGSLSDPQTRGIHSDRIGDHHCRAGHSCSRSDSEISGYQRASQGVFGAGGPRRNQIGRHHLLRQPGGDHRHGDLADAGPTRNLRHRHGPKRPQEPLPTGRQRPGFDLHRRGQGRPRPGGTRRMVLQRSHRRGLDEHQHGRRKQLVISAPVWHKSGTSWLSGSIREALP